MEERECRVSCERDRDRSSLAVRHYPVRPRKGRGVREPAIANEGRHLEGRIKTRGVFRVYLQFFLQLALDTTMARGACPETFSGWRVTD